jgi:adenine-specific DNA-methyltransferase
MELFATDLERLAFLLEADAALSMDPEDLGSEAAEQKTPEESPPEKRPKYITNYIGSKQKLVDWIWKHTPEGIGTVVDAFSGSAVVAYMYKVKGLRVIANDRLHYCHHAARAIIENNGTRVSDDEIEALLADNAKAKTFVQDNFKGIFFAKGVHALIDTLRANCDKLSGLKKDIALFALGKTCMSGKGGFGHFSSSTDYGKRQDSPDEFKQRFKDNLARINALVFDNGKENKAFRQDINDLLPKAKADLAYFDPPYATEFSTTNYERAYHFVEGLMTYWDGLTIKKDTKVKYYETDHQTVTKSNAGEFFRTFLGNAKHIPHWLISYRDHAYPNEQEMRKIIGSLGKQSRMQSKDHHYAITSRHGEASNAKERLFICSPASKSKADEQAGEKPVPLAAAANFHTSIPVEIQIADPEGLNAEAMDVGTAGDPQFSFILCRTGTNKNGDHFSAEELSGRHMTAVNKKIDLQHSQEFNDIVGGVVAADYLEDDSGGRVECVGELYINDTPAARLAYKLMKRGIISQVSMECDYQEGECSVCQKRFTNKADYCPHLRKFKGREYNGRPVYEVLHGVTFTGLGLLDRKGADENARILQVASVKDSLQSQVKGDSEMEDKTKPNDDPSKSDTDAAKKKPAAQDGDPAAHVTELEKENRQLKAQVAQLQKRIDELEAEQKAAACRSRAKKLLTKLEKKGLAFASDEERESELKRLAEMSDEAFAATEAAYERMTKGAKPEKGEPATDKDDENAKKAAKSSDDPPLRSDAGVRPRDVDDRKLSLEDRLRSGFMAAYHNRLGEESDETLQLDA